ncbi:MAG: hypothetical protein A2Y77_00555 [Planctomycetes bacterium RBG_13_62_9]|nr:MAG: hypothetical protein A2Y77_00555 [Planctomycetes bacterium RBG_13_62_9]
MKLETSNSKLDPRDDFDCSHALRLSGRDWLIVAVALLALIGLGPRLWERFEAFEPGNDYRMPYELSSDYWLYRRHCRQACDREKLLVVGDSVVWGHYVPPEQTLSHYLNEFSGAERFGNLGLDGTHPAALEGLLRYYGRALCGRTVLLHFNPLWLSSAKHDLQTDKEFHFNHPELVSQFIVPIPCYKASFSQRLRIAVRRTIPFSNWVSHLRATYYGAMDLQMWTLEHPYRNPLSPLARGLPKPGGIPEPSGGTWVEKGAKKQDLSWVEFDSSLQWRFLQRTIRLLRNHANQVFVLVGPFNEHMLNEADADAYHTIKTRAEAWFKENDVPCFVPGPLPAEHYVDASHPIGAGYALMARELLAQPAFQSLVADR